MSARVARVTAAAVLACAASACYTLAPVGGGPPPAGESVSVELNAIGRAALATEIGPDAMRLHGRVAGTSADTLVLDVSRVVRRSGEEGSFVGQRVEIPGAYTERVTRRTFSLSRTAALVAGAGVAAALLAPRIGLTGGGTGRQGGGGPPGPPKGS